jgi:hypothetical protein
MLFLTLVFVIVGLTLGGVANEHRYPTVGLPLHYSLENDVPVAPSLPLKSTSEMMDYANAKITAGLQDTLAQLTLILNLKDTDEGRALDSELALLKSKIMGRLHSDLLDKIDNVKWSRDKDAEETEDERIRFAQTLQLKWEETAQQELENWKQNKLPAWVRKSLPVWKGYEWSLKKRILKYTKFVKKNQKMARYEFPFRLPKKTR